MTLQELGLDADDWVQYVRGTLEDKRKMELIDEHFYDLTFDRIEHKELTWKDIRKIVQIADQMLNSLDYAQILRMGEEGYYTEILKRFKQW